MTRAELIAVLRLHPREAVVLATATQVLETIPDPGPDAVCACAWALDAARRWARGEADIEEVRAAYTDAYADAYAASASAYAADAADAAAYAAFAASAFAASASAYASAYAAYADAYAAYTDASADAYAASAAGDAADAAADAARSELAARLPPPGRWGPWHEARGIARAGDYIWRESEDRFISWAELTPAEAVALDEIEATYGAAS